MSTQELTYQIEEGEDGQRLVALIDGDGRPMPLQAGVAVQMSADNWLVIVWDENIEDHSSASFHVEDRAAALQVLDFHATLVARLIASQAVTA